jgi:sulfoxide reductase heme-binding subunit YedZ
MRAWISARITKVAVFALALAPLVWLAATDLGPNPIEKITHATGDWTLRFLVVTLAITPLRRWLNLPELIRFRRMAGLFAFFYGLLHFTTYLWLDKFFDLGEIVKDIAKRPFITVGFTGLALMLPLAATSTAGWIRRLGGARWRVLHRLVYVSAAAGVIHYYWLVKSDVRRPVFYGALVAALLVARLVAAVRRAPAKPVRVSSPV